MGARTMRTLAAGILGGMLVPAVAHGQQAALTADVPAERMRWIAGGDGVLDVEWGGVLPSLSLVGGLGMSVADDPLTIYTVNSNGQRVRVASPVKSRAGAELVASLGVADLLEIGMAMPFVLSQSSEPGSLMLPATSSAGFGDIRLHAKVALVGQHRVGVDAAATVVVAFPTATENTYFGDAGAVAEPGIAISRRFGGGLRGTVNLAYRLREQRTSIALVVDDELVGSAGVGFRLAERDGPAIELDASLSVATAADDALRSFDRNYGEVKLAAGFSPMPTISILAGGGVGIAEGYGTPNWRLFAGVRFSFSVLESFGGGDEEDDAGVPRLELAEVGSIAKPKADPPPPPPPDDDGDGLAGAADTCPYAPETANGYLDDDGCPDELPDGDQDGKADRDDKCPAEPEDADQFQDDDGCPELDDDGDGVADAADRCRLIAGVADNAGCPDPDTDGDTVVDRLDNCPQEAGKPANAGCKDKQLVRITADRLEILDVVHFRTDRADIRSKSFKLLDNVARVLIGHPDLEVRVEGHTDDEGDDAHNKDLSQRRAESVVAYLVKRGVPPGRLTPVGFGEEQPVADNKTRKGKAANRRVVFAIQNTTGPSASGDSTSTVAP